MKRAYILFLLLRMGVAFPLLYVASASLSNPLLWIDFIPEFISILSINELTLIYLFGLIDLALGLWILWGRHIFLPSLITSILVFGLVVFNLDQFGLIFRDISILSISLVLTIWSYDGKFFPNIINRR